MASAIHSVPALFPSLCCQGSRRESWRMAIKALGINSFVCTRKPSNALSQLNSESVSMTYGSKLCTSNQLGFGSLKERSRWCLVLWSSVLSNLWSALPGSPKSFVSITSRGHKQNSLPEQCHGLPGPSVLNLWTFLVLQGPVGPQPVCQLGLHTATLSLWQMAGSTAYMVAARTFPWAGDQMDSHMLPFLALIHTGHFKVRDGLLEITEAPVFWADCCGLSFFRIIATGTHSNQEAGRETGCLLAECYLGGSMRRHQRVSWWSQPPLLPGALHTLILPLHFTAACPFA